MNFNNFYNKTENRLKDSINSLWATGDATMQRYFTYLFEKEPLLSEPVFQNTFPWEPSPKKMANLTDIFDEKFINALDKVKNEDFKFPKDRNPYRHQVESWKSLLDDKKSIAVTTGTGSGKTECFMLPVLYDLYQNCKNKEGVNAIFLYPLNALIGSQKKRIHAWCEALGGIKYAVYNGNTDDSGPTAGQHSAFPELIYRRQIRETPPQILFTNPTMLEYILIRKKDTPLLKNSEGKLRWILLDEAHTLTGSSASEMALLIRRVVDAFKTDIKNIRFAITSATVGKGNDDHLKKFMSDLCGIDEGRVVIISGERTLNNYDENELENLEINKNVVEKLRSDFLVRNAFKLQEFKPYFQTTNKIKPLELIDKLAEKQILPVRGHFFSRGIGGVFVCTNPACNIHGENRPKSALGSMHTVAAKNCDCGWPVLELIACRSCGNYMMEGEVRKIKDKGIVITQPSKVSQNVFDIESEDEENSSNARQDEGNKVLIIRNQPNQRLSATDWEPVGFDICGTVNEKNSHLISHAGTDPSCPFCNEYATNPIHFRISSAFSNRILSDIILEEAPADKAPTKKMLWNGRKYISFTDSRQGTAKISALINIDNEKNWLRSMVYHSLCEKAKNSLKEQDSTDHTFSLQQLENELNKAPNQFIRTLIEQQIKTLETQIQNNSKAVKIRLSWDSLFEIIKNKTELHTLFNNNINDNFHLKWKSYLEAMFFDQFARRLPRERSLENLGMVNLVYPSLDKAILPDIAKRLHIAEDEWRDLLKIAADYIIRMKFHFIVPPDVWSYSNAFLRSIPISKEDWSKFDKNNIKPNRMALLICAGLDITAVKDVTEKMEDEINELLQELWKEISSKLLTNDNGSYKLDFYNKTEFELAQELYLCPVKQRLIDKIFKSYSPWITGRLSQNNIQHFKVNQEVTFPVFPYPFNLNDQNEIDHQQTKVWIQENSADLREKGVWNDLHERVIDIKPLFLAGEHSAQQNDKRLKELEGKFEKGELNVLNCSTTMEMGVDIGGISAVLMNNVPPGPANYLQRTGRAGRRAESKSLAFTICAPNPLGANAFNNPTWALDHKIAPPMLSFNSPAVVIRHINAFFLGKFIQSDAIQGINTTEKIEDFFLVENSLGLQFSNWLLALSNNEFSKELQAIVKGTSFENRPNSTYIDKARFNFEKIKNKVIQKIENYNNSLKTLAENFGENSAEYKAVNFQKNQFKEKNVISFFAEDGFVPSAGIPTGIVEMDLTTIENLQRNGNTRKSNPSFHITRALSEFAPGNQIVLDGWSYVSGGIITKNLYGDQSRKDIIQSCKKCGFQRMVGNSEENKLDASCPHCGEQKFRGINFSNAESGKFTELIEPVGFAVDIRESKSRKINESSNYSYVEPLLMNVRPWTTDDYSLIDIRESDDNAEILYYNKGRGDGFAVCLNCGRTEFTTEKLENHTRLRGGKNENDSKICEGNNNAYSIRQNVILGGRYQTDFCEIRLKNSEGMYIDDESLLYSLGVVFTKTLAEYLAIEEQELGFGIKKYDKYQTIFIFDTARGGAGYASQFSFHSESILEISLSKLENCDCKNACTKCLIDRNSNNHIDKLDRFPAKEWLISALDETIPDEIETALPGIKKILGNIKDDINKQAFRNAITEIWLNVDADINQWEIENAHFVTNLKAKAKINFILPENPSFNNEQDKISFISVKNWSSIFIESIKSDTILSKVASVKLIDGSIYNYYAEKYNNELGENWGTVLKGHSYRLKVYNIPSLEEIQNPTFGGSTAEVFINTNKIIKSNEIADLLLNQLKELNFDLEKEMKNEIFEIEYYDRYVKSPIACILLIQFVDKLRERLDFKIKNFKVNGKKFDELRSPTFFYNNFEKSFERNNFIQSFAQNNYDIPNVEVIEDDIPHYRFLSFSSANKKIIIRPDAGIEYGWRSNEHIKYSEIYDVAVFEIKRSDYNDILYTVSIEN